MTEQTIMDSNVVICGVVFAEIFNGMPLHQADRIIEHLQAVPMLTTPPTLWQDVIPLIRTCTKNGSPIGTMDALIGAIALRHNATIVTFDTHFLTLQKHCGVSVGLLSRSIF